LRLSLRGRGRFSTEDLDTRCLDLGIESEEPPIDTHRDRVAEVTLREQGALAPVGQVSGLDRDRWDVRVNPQFRLLRDAIIRDLVWTQRLRQAGIDRLGEGQAVRLRIKDGLAVDGRVTVEGVDVKADEKPGVGGVHAVPALGDLHILVPAPGQDHLDPLSLQQDSQPEGEVQGDVLLHHAAHHHARIPELVRVVRHTAAMARIDGDDVRRRHGRKGL